MDIPKQRACLSKYLQPTDQIIYKTHDVFDTRGIRSDVHEFMVIINRDGDVYCQRFRRLQSYYSNYGDDYVPYDTNGEVFAKNITSIINKYMIFDKDANKYVLINSQCTDFYRILNYEL